MYTPPDMHYTHYELTPEENERIFQIMGKEGNVFKAITKRSDVNYIWYQKEAILNNRVSSIIEIWGPHHNLTKAKQYIKERIEKIIHT